MQPDGDDSPYSRPVPRIERIIEDTDEPDYFGSYSPDLEGFTGIGHSVEDCLYQAKWGVQESLQIIDERNMTIQSRNGDSTVVIENTRRDSFHQGMPAGAGA
jgi:hypothetical protein